MRITFLGTGTSAGVPLIGCDCEVCSSKHPRDKRLRCSLLIEVNNQTLCIDIGPDFRQQMLSANVKKLDAILLTHPHRDHIAGLDEIRAFNFITKQPVDIYCNQFSEEGLRDMHSYVFRETDYPYMPKLNIHRIDNEQFAIGNTTIQPITVMHAQMPVLGFRFGNFTYITDAKTISEEEKAKVHGTKTLVVNALRYQQHYSHFTTEEALAFVEEIKPERAYFIHMSHQFGLHEVMQQRLPSNIFVAYDGLQITC